MVTNFSFQANCPSDVERFKDEASNEGIPLRWGVEDPKSREAVPLRLIDYPETKVIGAIEVHMQTSVDLGTIREVMTKVPDGHVMFETLQGFQVAEAV